MTPLEIQAAVRGCGLGHWADRLAQLARPCVLMQPQPGAGARGCRLGGRPDLAVDQEWPRRDGRPLPFLGQVDLAAVAAVLPRSDLPDRGLLSFFYDVERQPWGYRPQEEAGCVLWSKAATVRRAPYPSDLDVALPPCGLSTSLGWTLPPWESGTFASLGMSQADTARYVDVFETLTTGEGWGQRSFLLGHPDQLQDDLQEVCAQVTAGIDCMAPAGHDEARAEVVATDRSRWRLLLQLASERAAGMSWGDAGCLYFCIDERDLVRRRFERVRPVLQCF